MASLRSVLSSVLLVAPLAAANVRCSDGDGDTTADTTVDDTTDAADTLSDVDVTADSEADTETDAEADAAPRYADTFTAVEIEAGTSAAMRLAIQACAGLYNRDLGGSAYTQADEKDRRWLEELDLEPAEVLTGAAFLDACMERFPSCVRYSYATQQVLLPNILTVGAALGAVPLDADMETACDDVVFDATVELADHDTPALATQLVFERYGSATTGLAMLNPGYATEAEDLAHPPVSHDMSDALVDFVFARRLFTVFLVNGCQSGSPERDVLSEVVNGSDWQKPIGVYGYNNSWNVGGYLFEAQTRCLDSANMGAIPTETSNLSFFATRRPPITEPGVLVQNPRDEVEYDAAKNYVAFVIGDGDNINFIMSTRNVWLGQRLEECAREDAECPPITWTISPHLPWIAPDVLEWYFAQTHETGHDYFTLPPSGHLYAYPSSMGAEDQQRFAEATEHDARILGTTSTVHWDWWETWRSAVADFLPRYAHQDTGIRGIFPVNVPYMFPAFDWWEADRFYDVLTGEDGGEVVVFRPRQWRGINNSGSGITESFFLSPDRMAEELGGYPAGTVTVIYMTSDGGLSLQNSFMELVRILPENVVIVSADTAVELALDAFHAGE